jgi:hypothetical protein
MSWLDRNLSSYMGVIGIYSWEVFVDVADRFT